MQKVFQYYCKDEYRQRSRWPMRWSQPQSASPMTRRFMRVTLERRRVAGWREPATEDCRLAVGPVEATDKTSRETPLFLLLLSPSLSPSPLSFDPCSFCWQLPAEEHLSHQMAKNYASMCLCAIKIHLCQDMLCVRHVGKLRRKDWWCLKSFPRGD